MSAVNSQDGGAVPPNSQPNTKREPQVPDPDATLGTTLAASSASVLSTNATWIGPYHLVRKLGEGGMGEVWLAEQTAPVTRQVALKVIRTGWADNAALQRFNLERQALAIMDHPGIAKVFDAGSTPLGQPYFVMEYVPGLPITSYCASQKVRTRERLELVIKVCEGVQHAHRKAILHRDLKPSNILVVEIDGKPTPRIIDFGIAKAVSTGANEESQMTVLGGMIGTPGYMSPEQTDVGTDLDARTDVYSLGVILYELLTETLPFDPKEWQAKPLREVLRQLHEDDPPSPSTRIQLEARKATASGQKEKPEVRQLARLLSGDLDWITLKALEKDRARRYDSCSALAMDLRRHLDHEPVLAAPPSLAYRARKFVRRNRVQVAGASASALLLMSLVLIVGGIFWFREHRGVSSPSLLDVQLRQLTSNSPENQVSGGAISPDGKYLAYTDAKGIHAKNIESGELRSIAPPQELKNGSVNWEVMNTWFPDSERFVANAHPAAQVGRQWSSEETSAWKFSLRGEPPRKLRDNALAWSVSPDGSSISFGTRNTADGNQELWLMGPNGEQAHKFCEAGKGNGIGALYFFPNGKRVAYFISNDETGDSTLLTRDLKGGAITTLFGPSETAKMGDGTWLPDGRFLYSEKCVQARDQPDAPCNYWIRRRDPITGKEIEAPRRLTNWVGFTTEGLAATADGKRVSFLRVSNGLASYVADLQEGGTRLTNSRRVALDELGEDGVMDWTTDSKSLILAHNRGGHYGISLKLLGGETLEPIVASEAGILEEAIVSPDGKWVLLLVRPTSTNQTLQTSLELMRVSISGGTPELIVPVHDESLVFCAKSISTLCAVAEPAEDGKGVTVTSVDPLGGRGSVLTRFNFGSEADSGSNHPILFAISPDGNRLAFARSPNGPIEVHSLRDHSQFMVPTGGLDKVWSIQWAADSKGLFVATEVFDGGELFYLNPQGRTYRLWKSHGGLCNGQPSPDGRQIAVFDSQRNSNMWMIENF